MTLRFRNRFKGETGEVTRCNCGLRLAESVADGRLTVIHELPWCAAFRAFAEKSATLPDAANHVALVAPELGETIVIADGDTPADVEKGHVMILDAGDAN